MIVTISNQFGSGGVAIAEGLAAELGYACVDRELPVVVAKRLSITPAQAQAADEAGKSLGSRLLSSLERATPELATQAAIEPFDAVYVREVQEAVREYAARGNVVIVGRAGGAILGRRADVLRVFLYAPREWRVERVAERLGADPKAAAAEVDRIDRARRAHLRDWYGAEFGGHELVDVALDTSMLSVERCVGILAATVHARK